MSIKKNNSTLTLEKIFDIHASLMYGCIYKIVTHTETAENLLKEIFFDLHKNARIYKLNIEDSMWFAKFASKKAFTFIKTTPYQKDFAITAMQQILDMKNVKFAPASQEGVSIF